MQYEQFFVYCEPDRSAQRLLKLKIETKGLDAITDEDRETVLRTRIDVVESLAEAQRKYTSLLKRNGYFIGATCDDRNRVNLYEQDVGTTLRNTIIYTDNRFHKVPWDVDLRQRLGSRMNTRDLDSLVRGISPASDNRIRASEAINKGLVLTGIKSTTQGL